MKTAFLFPGQGAQTVGMGRQLALSTPKARELFDRAAVILGYDLLAVCLDGPAEKLDSTVYSQPALFVTSLAALEWLCANKPDVFYSCQAVDCRQTEHPKAAGAGRQVGRLLMFTRIGGLESLGARFNNAGHYLRFPYGRAPSP